MIGWKEGRDKFIGTKEVEAQRIPKWGTGLRVPRDLEKGQDVRGRVGGKAQRRKWRFEEWEGAVQKGIGSPEER